MSKKVYAFSMVSLLVGFSAGCGPTQAELDSETTKIVADIFATQTAQAPIQIIAPTLTPAATFTPSSTPIPPAATSTPIPPTETPVPVLGDMIAYAAPWLGGEEVYMTEQNPGGGFPTKLTDLGSQSIFEVIKSPDSQRIAFIAEGHGDSSIYVMNVNGTGLTQLVSFDNDLSLDSLTWSRDGKWLAFEKTGMGKWQDIFVINAKDGSGLKNLTEANFDDKQPAWSPSSDLIAFASARNPSNPAFPSSAIYIMKADGSDQTNIIENPYPAINDVSPVWSPDGTKLAFVSDRTGDNELYVIDLKANTYMRISEVQASRAWPISNAWSPDGEWIAFAANVDFQYNIYVIKADGSGEMIRLRDGPENPTDLVWSLDGTTIAFTSGKNSAKNISIVSIDDSGLTR